MEAKCDTIPRNEGKIVDEHRVFVFRDARPGVRYRGTMLEKDADYELLGPVELVAIQQPTVDPNQLPLPSVTDKEVQAEESQSSRRLA